MDSWQSRCWEGEASFLSSALPQGSGEEAGGGRRKDSAALLQQDSQLGPKIQKQEAPQRFSCASEAFCCLQFSNLTSVSLRSYKPNCSWMYCFKLKTAGPFFFCHNVHNASVQEILTFIKLISTYYVIRPHRKLRRKMAEVCFSTLEIRKPELKMRSSWIRGGSNPCTVLFFKTCFCLFYLFLSVLGLRGRAGVSLVAASRGPSPAVMCRLLAAETSLLAERGP